MGRSTLARHSHKKLYYQLLCQGSAQKEAGSTSLLWGHIIQCRRGGLDGSVQDRHVKKRCKEKLSHSRTTTYGADINLFTSMQVLNLILELCRHLLAGLSAFKCSLPHLPGHPALFLKSSRGSSCSHELFSIFWLKNS